MEGATMLSQKRSEYLAGGLLITVVVSVVLSIILSPISDEAFTEDVNFILTAIADDSGKFAAFIVFDTLANLIAIPLAAALFMVFRSRDRNLALLGSVGFLAGGILWLSADMAMISLETIANDFSGASGAQADSLLTTAGAIIPIQNAAFLLGATCLSLGLLSYGLLVLRSGAIPKWIGIFGVLTGVIGPLGWLNYIDSSLVVLTFIGAGISLLFALLTGGWLVTKGTTEAA
jgi:hypothetical protein